MNIGWKNKESVYWQAGGLFLAWRSEMLRRTRRLLISCLFLWFFMPGVIYAQNECNWYILKVDSLIKADNLDIDGKHKPDSQCESILLDFTKDKGYLGDSTVSYISDILSYLSKNGTLKTTREQAINALLLRKYHFDIGRNYSFHKEDFNEQALARLKDLLRKRYTRVEETRYIQDDAKYMLKENRIKILATHEANKRQISYEEAKDSIIYSILSESRIKLYNEGYSINLPLLIGWYNMREFIPLLDSIQDSGRGGIQFQLALARMGNKKYQDYFMQMANIEDQSIAFYIGTQDMIAKYGEQLYSEKKKVNVSGSMPYGLGGTNEQIPIKYNIIIDLQNNIANFPKLIDSKFYLGLLKDIDALPPDVVEKARQWMKGNKGKYIISPDFTPDFNNLILDKYRKQP